MTDRSCIPCAGKHCFVLPVADRVAMSQERHACPAHPDVDVDEGDEWRCRCCKTCTLACGEVPEYHGD